MSDAFWDNLFRTAATIFGAWMTYKMAMIGKEVSVVRHETNSMKDALVKAAGEVGHAEGVEAERNRPEKVVPSDPPIPPTHPRNGPQLGG